MVEEDNEMGQQTYNDYRNTVSFTRMHASPMKIFSNVELMNSPIPAQKPTLVDEVPTFGSLLPI